MYSTSAQWNKSYIAVKGEGFDQEKCIMLQKPANRPIKMKPISTDVKSGKKYN